LYHHLLHSTTPSWFLCLNLGKRAIKLKLTATTNKSRFTTQSIATTNASIITYAATKFPSSIAVKPFSATCNAFVKARTSSNSLAMANISFSTNATTSTTTTTTTTAANSSATTNAFAKA
jgi:hypothetical protein